jgi:uncharacterized protein (TIGR03067 family)
MMSHPVAIWPWSAAMIRLSAKSRFLAIVVAAVCTVLGRAATVVAQADKIAGELDGMWKLVAVEQDGEVLERDDDVRWVVTGGQVFYAGELLAAMTTYAASTPQGLDLAFRAPKNDYEGIYALEKDELKICLNASPTGPKNRPSDFATKGKPDLRVLTFARVDASAGPGTLRCFVGMAMALENEMVVIRVVL